MVFKTSEVLTDQVKKNLYKDIGKMTVYEKSNRKLGSYNSRR
jgi:hypothetical protein